MRGGMVLRILGCERFTNDLDYVFVPYRSKKDVVNEVLEVSVEDRFHGSTVQDFYAFLRQRVQKLTNAEVREELQDYLPEEQLPGLAQLFKAEIGQL